MAFDVTVDFNANVAKFSKQVDKLGNNLTKFGKTTETGIGVAKNALVGFAGAFGALQITSFLRAGIDTADMLSKLSTRTGVAVESLAGLKHAADLSDTSLSEVGRSINKLSIFMGQNAEASKELGLTAEKPIEAFLQFADIFSNIDDEQTKAALGNKVLGESYANLAPLLSQGSDALRSQIKSGQEYLPVTKKMAEQSAKFNDNLAILSANTSSFAITLAGPIVEGFNSLITKMQEATKESNTFSNKIKGFANFAFDADFKTSKMDKLADDIKFQIARVNVLKKEVGVGSDKPALAVGAYIDNILGYDVVKEERRLDQMIAELESLTTKFNQKGSALGQKIRPKKKNDTANVANVLKGGNSKTVEQNNLQRQAATLFQSTRTELEKLTAKKQQYKTLLDQSAISQETFNRAVKQAQQQFNASNSVNSGGETLKDIQDRIKAKQLEIDQNNSLLQQRLKSKGQTNDARFNPGFFDKQDLKKQTDSAGQTIKEGLANIKPELPLTITANAQQAIDVATAVTKQIQDTIKPIEIPIIYKNQAGNSFSDRPIDDAALAGGKR